MAFNFNQQGENSNNNAVDFDGLNQHIIDAVQAEQPDTLQGVIAGIVDLGEQEMPDAQYELKGEREVGKTLEELNEEFKDEIADGSITKFDKAWNGQTKQYELMKFVPQKNRHCIDLMIDFPDVEVDKGQFFGESKPLPYRMSLGGKFYQKGKGKMLLQRLIPLKLKKEDNIGWTLPVNSMLYRMAIAGKVIEKGQPFTPQEIDKLLGLNLQFTVHVYNKVKDGRKFFTESIKFASGLGRGMKAVEDYPTFLIQFEDDNDEKSLKELRKEHINQIEESPLFNGSKLQSQLLKIGKIKDEEDSGKDEEDQKEKSNTTDLDSDLPF
jgi:hypothetical protein